MNRSRLAAALGLLCLTGLVSAVPTPAYAADPCLRVPVVGQFMNPGTPTLTTHDEVATIVISYFGERELWPDCSGITATVQKADGTHRGVVPFDGGGSTPIPPEWWITAGIPIPLADGAGDWVVTEVTHGTESLPVSVRFRILRGTVTTIDQPATVTSPAKTTVTGLVRRYTSTGSLAAMPAGTPVRIMHQNGTSLIATATTDSAGRYKVLVPFTVNTTMRAVTPDTSAYRGSSSGLVTAYIRAGLVRLVNSSTGYVNVWWRISGLAYPGHLWTTLAYWNGSAWVDTQSFGYSAADGSFTRWWKPAAPGTFRLRISLSNSQVEGTPIVREKTVTVTSKQTQPTYLSGVVGPTSDPVPVVGSKMSTYGHLKVRYTTGAVGPLANQNVLVQARRLTTPVGPWDNVAGARTTSTGYYYTNWNVGYPEDLEVRVVYTSPYVTIKSAVLNLGVIDVR
jgi:hypothetical protein